VNSERLGMNAIAPHTIRLTINGQTYERTVPARRTLVDFIRYDIGLTGTKEACSVGVCGACTVMLNGEIIASCITLAVQADGAEITTIEGLGTPDNLSPVQKAFIECGGFQCGICTPGQIVAATALLKENPKPTEDEIKEWLMGNLCRCTGYYQIIESVQKASGQL
jgi:carbon-monoxide dehydrogenase small subunit